jgi:hypothetical protein
VTGLLWALLALRVWPSHPAALPAYLALGLACVALVAIDLGSRLLPDRITYPSLGLIAALLLVASLVEHDPGRMVRALEAAGVAGGILLALTLPGRAHCPFAPGSHPEDPAPLRSLARPRRPPRRRRRRLHPSNLSRHRGLRSTLLKWHPCPADHRRDGPPDPMSPRSLRGTAGGAVAVVVTGSAGGGWLR